MPSLEPVDVRFFDSPAALRDWLDANHASAAEAWVGMHPKASGRPSVTWEELVDEVLCVGWIDGLRQRVDGGSAIRITPRRNGSVWSARNVARVEALRAQGRMRPAGEAAFARRREDRTAIYSFDGGVELDADAEAALRADPAAWTFWETLPRSYRRAASHWVMSAKRSETRARRLVELVRLCAAGQRLPALSSRPRDRA